jgi:hypothetical protein
MILLSYPYPLIPIYKTLSSLTMPAMVHHIHIFTQIETIYAEYTSIVSSGASKGKIYIQLEIDTQIL